jgi:formylglycine-generating enzyme required for sulfatase activity/predicted phosphodiesterase
MNEITILHLSDLHIKDGDSYASDVVLKGLIEAIASFKEQGRKPDLIAVTGDIVNSGKEYGERTTRFFDDLLKAAGLEKKRLFIVPGNHDADKDECDGLIRTLDAQADSDNHPDKYFAPGKRQRHFDKFQKFESWYNGYFDGIRSLKPRTTCQPPEELEINGLRINVMLINSALFAYPDEKDHNRLWIGCRCLDEAIGLLPQNSPDLRIALLHHPLEWLNDAERANIKTILQTKCDVLLRGHLHETDITSVFTAQGGTLYAAAGACYQESPYPKQAHYIRFNFDTNKAIVFPIRYESTPQRIWTVNPSLFPKEPYEEVFDLKIKNSDSLKQKTRGIAGQLESEGMAAAALMDKSFYSEAQEPEKRLNSIEPAVDPAALRKAYLNRLFETTSRVSLSGIDPNIPEDTRSHLQLSSVYTALLTLTPEHERDVMKIRKPDQERELLSALEQLEQHHRLVLMGDPGSGKSTFVNFATMCLAGELLGNSTVNLNTLKVPLPDDKGNEGKKAQSWKHGALLPVRIILRDFAARGLPDHGQPGCVKHLWDFITRDLAGSGIHSWAGFLKKELLEQGGLLLLDGLDEVPEADYRRAQIKQVVQDLAATYKKCRILVTSRTYAYQKQDWKLPGFTEAILAPFSQGQIRRFVDRWYAHTAELRGTNRDDARGRAVLLKQVIFASERLRILAERPLLLTLMASLHAWRGGELPEKREQLYADATELLLETWQKAQIVRDSEGKTIVVQPSLIEWLKVDREKMRALLNEVSFEAHGKQPDLTGTADIAETDLVGKIMALTRRDSTVNPVLLVEFLSQRAGLLIPHGNGVYTFPHRTFQEYLAACYLAKKDYPRLLAGLVRREPDRWRETALLAGAKAAEMPYALWGLVEALLVEPALDEGPLAGDWGALVAGQLITESANLTDLGPAEQTKLEQVRQRQAQIMEQGKLPAVERVAAGRVLGRIGDPRKAVTTLDEMEFCLVPAGLFWMGSDDYNDNERPLHINQTLEYDYRISRYPVTNAQFFAFIKDGGYQDSSFWVEARKAGVWREGKIKGRWDEYPHEKPYDFGEPFNLPNHPVVGITWYDALAFTHWLTRLWRREGLIDQKEIVTLPNEPEWEKAARGGDQIPAKPIIRQLSRRNDNKFDLIDNLQPKRKYPWDCSDQFDPNLANGGVTGIDGSSAPGCFLAGASPYGVQELSGNVWEWTRSIYKKYPYSINSELKDFSSSDYRVLRGGSWHNQAVNLRSSFRNFNRPDYRYNDIGFRVVLCVARALLPDLADGNSRGVMR